MSKRDTLRLALILFTASILAGCGADESGSSATGTATATDARTLLDQGSDALDAIDSVRFDLQVEGETFVDEAETIRLLSAQGTLVRPGNVDVQFRAELLGTQTVSIRMITIGEESWTTNLVTGAWEPAPDEFGYNPAVLFDEQNGLSAVARQLENPTLEGEETIGGRETWRVSGTVSNEVITPLASGTIDGDPVTITIWLDQETSQILRLRVAEPDDAPKDNSATWTMTLTGHGQDLTVEPPDLDS